MNDLADTAYINPLLPQIEALEQAGARRFDPVRFRFIESMAERIHQQHGQAKKLIEKKTLTALAQLREQFEREQAQAKVTIAEAGTQFPELAEPLAQLWQQGDFNAISRSLQRHQRQRQSLQQRRQLLELTEQLNHNDPVEYGAQPTLKHLLQQQETTASQHLRKRKTNSGELKSIRNFRESLSKIHSGQLVENSVSEGPKDAGPLNPEKLAIRSLSAIRDLSPQYLNRFVSYVETLLWLQQIEQRNRNPATKKTGARKAR